MVEKKCAHNIHVVFLVLVLGTFRPVISWGKSDLFEYDYQICFFENVFVYFKNLLFVSNEKKR